MATATTIVTRRGFLAVVAGLAPLMFVTRVAAFPSQRVPGYGSRDEAKRDCANSKGASWGEGRYSTACHCSGGTKVCDENGQNCTWRPPAEASGRSPGPFADPIEGLDALPDLTEQPAANADDGEDGDNAPNPKAKPGKKGRKRRKR